MPSLTPELLDNYPYYQQADTQTIQRGYTYHKIGRVRDISLFNNNRRAVCEVEGNSGDYIVEIEVDQKTGRLHFDCDCPYAGNHFCKHMIAAAMELATT